MDDLGPRDLTEVYTVTTKALNQAVKRNEQRFPPDFRFQLTREERDEVVTNCDHLQSLKYAAALPWAFTEHGSIMVALVLSSSPAVEMSVFGDRDPPSLSDRREPVLVGTVGCEVVPMLLNAQSRGCESVRKPGAEIAVGEENEAQAARSYRTACSISASLRP
jgi:ORF6N domain